MRRLGLLFVLLTGLASSEARAQFANHSISLSVGYLTLGDPSVSGGVPIGLGFSKYIDNGFEFTSRASAMILSQKATGLLVWGFEGGPGFRYLFLEEEFRPYLGLELSVRYITGIDTAPLYFGFGPVVGFDYFVSDQFSIGARGQFDLYLMLNAPLQVGGGGSAVFAAYF